MFKLEFSTDNAAFEGEGGREECARILRAIVARLESGSQEQGPAFDTNGNRVGEWSLSLPETDDGEPERDSEAARIINLYDAEQRPECPTCGAPVDLPTVIGGDGVARLEEHSSDDDGPIYQGTCRRGHSHLYQPEEEPDA